MEDGHEPEPSGRCDPAGSPADGPRGAADQCSGTGQDGMRDGCCRPLVTVIRATSSASSSALWCWPGRSQQSWPAPDRLAVRPGAPAVTWPGPGPAGHLLAAVLQVAFVVAAAWVVAAVLRHRRFRLLAGLAAGAAVAGGAVAGILYLAGRPAPARGNGRCRAQLAAGQRGVSRAGPARCGGCGHCGRGSVAEPSLAPGSMAHPGCRSRGPADHRHGAASRADTGAGCGGDRQRRRAGDVRRTRPADGTWRDRGRAAVRRACQ